MHFLVDYFTGSKCRINVNSNLAILMMPQTQNYNFGSRRQQIFLPESSRMKTLYDPLSLIFWRDRGVRILAYSLLLALFLPALKIDTTLAIFFFSGNDPLSVEFLNTCIKGAFMSLYTD